MHILNSMRIKANRKDVLEKLVANRSRHAAIVEEARAGYIAKAKEKLLARLDELNAGKIHGAYFSLEVPVDHTKVYDTAIEMLRLHTEDKIELDAGQVRNLCQDQWDWTERFYQTNMMYSKMAEDTVGAGAAPDGGE